MRAPPVVQSFADLEAFNAFVEDHGYYVEVRIVDNGMQHIAKDNYERIVASVTVGNELG